MLLVQNVYAYFDFFFIDDDTTNYFTTTFHSILLNDIDVLNFTFENYTPSKVPATLFSEEITRPETSRSKFAVFNRTGS